jgi:hypothetical protein
MEIKYPQVKVKLVGCDGNAFVVLGKCLSAARKAGLDKDQIAEFRETATSGDYDNLLITCMQYFDCE